MNPLVKKIKVTLNRTNLLVPLKFVIFFFTKRKKASQEAKLYNIAPTFGRINNMIWMMSRYRLQFDEYFIYDVEHRTKKEIADIVPYADLWAWVIRLNKTEDQHYFENKNETYEAFKKYYKRDACFIDASKPDSCKDFEKFFNAHQRFIAKPINAYCGKGVRLINTAEHSDIHKLYNELNELYGSVYFIEECIEQCREMADFHPSSVNTVRVPTIRYDNSVKIIHPFFRMGQKGSVVDNAGSGGVFAVVDADTGKLLAACDYLNNNYTNHPDTGKQIVGETIPRWEEAKALVRELAYVFPENRYTGWDLALTDDGWTVVEANFAGEFTSQRVTKVGFKPELVSIFNELGIEPYKK